MSSRPEDAAPAAPAQADAPSPAQVATSDEKEPSTYTPTPGKSVRTLILDTGALIKNEPTVSTLLAEAEELYTIPAVLAEIRDAETRRRVDTTLRPFLKLRTPKAESIRFITGFARRTGDLEVLSAPDIHLLALTYELECENNGGDWRLRNTPAQKQLNGKAPGAVGGENSSTQDGISDAAKPAESEEAAAEEVAQEAGVDTSSQQVADDAAPQEPSSGKGLEDLMVKVKMEDEPTATTEATKAEQDGAAAEQIDDAEEEDGDSDDSDGWITPSNLKKQMAKDNQSTSSANPAPQFLQAALLTTDYAMQNVALRVNLNLLSPTMFRITRVRTYVLRCHGCFKITKDMTKQFCPSCGQPNLIRTSCSTDQNGAFQVHLRKNFEYNKRGNVYSIPKPVHGTSSGKTAKVQGGGAKGWGQTLVLAEDQKEYVRARDQRQRQRQRDLMDEDYLPNILTGERKGSGDRIRVGAGRSVNSRRRA